MHLRRDGDAPLDEICRFSCDVVGATMQFACFQLKLAPAYRRRAEYAAQTAEEALSYWMVQDVSALFCLLGMEDVVMPVSWQLLHTPRPSGNALDTGEVQGAAS